MRFQRDLFGQPYVFVEKPREQLASVLAIHGTGTPYSAVALLSYRRILYMASGRSNLRKHPGPVEVRPAAGRCPGTGGPNTSGAVWLSRLDCGCSRSGNLDSIPEIDAARQLEARGLPHKNSHPGALESALAEAAARADLADSAAAHLEEYSFELQRERNRELEPREEHLLGE